MRQVNVLEMREVGGREGSEPTADREAISSHVVLLTSLLTEFEARGVCYCLLRNFEGVPKQIDDDIDILVQSDHLGQAEQILLSLMKNFFLIERIERNRHLQFCVASRKEMDQAIRENRICAVVRLDFVVELQWQGIAYLDTEAVLASRQRYNGFYVAAPDHRVAHLLCHALLDKNHIKGSYKAVIEGAIHQNNESMLMLLTGSIGQPMVRRLTAAVRTGDDTQILQLRTSLIRRLVFHSPQSFFVYIQFLIEKYLRFLNFFLFPRGVLIATAGPDGAGKSTLLERIATVLSASFDQVREQYMGWKQFILPTKRLFRLMQSIRIGRTEQTATGDSHTKSNASWANNFAVLHYFLDLWARYLFQIRPALVRRGLVLCDRYFYDILVREVWLSRTHWFCSLLLAITPRPTVTVLLAGDPEIIAARKQEISTVETARQIDELSRLVHHSRRVLPLEATNAPEENAAAVINVLLDRSAKEPMR
jgi:thymidylate kinase